MGVTGQVGVARLLGVGQERALQTLDQLEHLVDRRTGPEPEIGGDLIIATTAGVHLGAGGLKFSDSTLDGSVDVLVVDLEVERARLDLVLDRVEGSEHTVTLGLGEQANIAKHADMRPRPGDVLTEHALVERQAVVQRLQRLRRATGEPTVPQRRAHD